MVTEGQVANGQPTLTSRSLSWQLNGYRFEVKSYSDQITNEDLVRIAGALAPVP